MNCLDLNFKPFLSNLSKDFLLKHPDFLDLIDGKFEVKDGNNCRPINYA